MEAAGNHALEERELVGVVGVEGGAVDAGGVGDLLDGELVEVAGAEESGQGLLEVLAGAADARVCGIPRAKARIPGAWLGVSSDSTGVDGVRGGFGRGGGVCGDGRGECHGMRVLKIPQINVENDRCRVFLESTSVV